MRIVFVARKASYRAVQSRQSLAIFSGLVHCRGNTRLRWDRRSTCSRTAEETGDGKDHHHLWVLAPLASTLAPWHSCRHATLEEPHPHFHRNFGEDDLASRGPWSTAVSATALATLTLDTAAGTTRQSQCSARPPPRLAQVSIPHKKRNYTSTQILHHCGTGRVDRQSIRAKPLGTELEKHLCKH